MEGDKREPTSEAVERPWASNDKVQFDNLISHCKSMMNYSELAVKEALDFQVKANNDYLEASKQMRNAYMEQANGQNKANLSLVEGLHHQLLENNRYTLDRLYSVFPEEAAGLATLVKIVIETLRQSGQPAQGS